MKVSQIIWEIVSQLFGVIFQHATVWLWVLLLKFVYVLMGVVFGWVIGLFFGATILGILADLGISGYAMWQIGAFLGFVGSFFGSTTNIHNSTKQNQPQQQKYPDQNYFRH